MSHHLAADCPHPTLPKRCHHCKSPVHLIGDCPALGQERRKQKQSKQEIENKTKAGKEENKSEVNECDVTIASDDNVTPASDDNVTVASDDNGTLASDDNVTLASDDNVTVVSDDTKDATADTECNN